MQRKKKHKVLVVEDDRTSRKILIHILEAAGYDVVDCGEGRDAIHMAQMNPPIAMVVDVMLPDMQGTEIIEELQYFAPCRFIKTIFLTGILKNKGLSETCKFDINGKAYRALPKPVKKSLLLKLLKEVIDEAIAEQEEIRRLAEEKEKAAIEEMKELKRLEEIMKKEAEDKSEGGWGSLEDEEAKAGH